MVVRWMDAFRNCSGDSAKRNASRTTLKPREGAVRAIDSRIESRSSAVLHRDDPGNTAHRHFFADGLGNVRLDWLAVVNQFLGLEEKRIDRLAVQIELQAQKRVALGLALLSFDPGVSRLKSVERLFGLL